MTDSIRFAWRRLVNRDGTLTHATLRVLLELESYTDPDGTNGHPGIPRLAEHLLNSEGRPISKKTVERALKAGRDRGWIERTKQGHSGGGFNDADVYRLTFPQHVLNELDDAPGSAFDDAPTDTQMSPDAGGTDRHSDVSRSDKTDRHFEPSDGHFEPTDRHPDVYPPVPNTRSSTPEKRSPSRGTSPARGGAREEEPPTPPHPDPVERPLTQNADAELPSLRRVEDALRGFASSIERKKAEDRLADGLSVYAVINELRRPREKARQDQLNAREQLEALARRRAMAPKANQAEARTTDPQRPKAAAEAEAEPNEARKTPAPQPPPTGDEPPARPVEEAQLHDRIPRNFTSPETAPCPTAPSPIPAS